ncbi:MAG: pitrilysin family protein [Pseudomonadota bacterium]|nr:pitrilysin family protein [Pseudomonadota bacterium]
MNRLILLFYLILGCAQISWAIPQIQHWQTDKGTQVYFVSTMELPMVDIEVVFDAGSARDGAQPGIAMLTNGLLSEGAGGRSANELAEQFENVGAEFSNFTGRDMADVSLRSLTDPALLQPALDALALLLTQPDFAAVAFKRVQQQMLASLKHQQQTPGPIAEQAFFQAVFKDHPYAHLSEGSLESIKALTIEAVKAFYQRYYVANNAIISIVGALKRLQAEQLVQTLTAQLPSGTPPAELPAVAALTTAETVRINHPATQTHLLMGQPGIARGDEDYFALYVGNYILGGSGFASRLMNEIREKRGLAYSTYSYFLPLKAQGPFMAAVETRNEQSQHALEVLRQTIAEFIKTGPTETELKEAKQGITGKFPLRIKSNSNIIGYLSLIGFYQLPLDYLHTFNQKVEAVTLEAIQTAFKEKLKLDQFVTVMVGGQS